MKIYTSKRLQEAASQVAGGWPSANLTAQKRAFRPKVVFDLHQTLVDWVGPFCAFASDLYKVNIDPKKVRFYSLAYQHDMPITPDEFNNAFWAFVKLAQGGYDALPALPGAVESFKSIQAAGITPEIWTYVPGAGDADRETLLSAGTGMAQDATYELVVRLGLAANLKEARRMVRFIHPNRKLPEMAKEFIPLIVEDNPVTAVEAGAVFGQNAILLSEPYGIPVTCQGVLKLKDRKDLGQAVIGYFKALQAQGALLGEIRQS